MRSLFEACSDHRCGFFQSGVKPEILLIQPVDERGLDHMEGEASKIEGRVSKPFLLASFGVKEWNTELSPWEAPAAFGNERFGGSANKTLGFVVDHLIPYIRSEYDIGEDIPMVIGGYSLAGLFSLWSLYETGLFTGCAAASPSVWFPKWMEFAEGKIPSAEVIYLSLGDREEKTKNALMSRVGDNIRRMAEIYINSGITSTFEMNEGNHFKDADIRTAKAFAWCIKNCEMMQ